MDRERVSLSLKATQEDPWQQFARTHQIGQVVPGKVTKLVPFGSFVRVDEGIEGLVHISELAERHVEIPEQVVQVGDEIFVKVIDIDLERRRISLSLKQANEGVAPGRGRRQRVRPDALRHVGLLRRGGRLPVPRRLRPGDQRVAARARGAAGRVGAPVRRGADPLRGAHEAGRGGRRRPRPRRAPSTGTAPSTYSSEAPAAADESRRHHRRRRHPRLRRGARRAAREAHRRLPTSTSDARPRTGSGAGPRGVPGIDDGPRASAPASRR